MAKFSAMEIANAVAKAVNAAQSKKGKPPKAQAMEEPSLNSGKSGADQANPDDAMSDKGLPVATNESKPQPNKAKKPAFGTVKAAKK